MTEELKGYHKFLATKIQTQQDLDDLEDCRKYPWMPKCKKFVEGLDIKQVLSDPEYQPIVERAFERLEQALETGLVSKTKIPKTITKDELRYHENRACSLEWSEAMSSWNIISQVYEGKIKVV